MSVLYGLDFEDGTLDAFGGVINGTDFTASSSAALAGTELTEVVAELTVSANKLGTELIDFVRNVEVWR